MKIVIPGGSGMLGQALVPALKEDGHQPVILTRDPDGAPAQEGVQVVGWDGKTARGWLDALEGAGAIINLAGANIGARPWSPARKQLIRDSRTRAGQAVVEAVRSAQARPALLLQISGIGVYGPTDQPVREDTPAGNDFQASVVQDWEASTQAIEGLGVRRVILRTAPVLTRAGGVLAPFLLQQRLFAGGPLGSGRQWLSWIHVQDFVAAVRFFLAREESAGVYNLSAPQPVTNAEFIRTLAKIMRRPYWLPAPAFAIRLVLGEMSSLVLEGQPVYPARLQALGFTFRFPELRQALEDLVGKNP